MSCSEDCHCARSDAIGLLARARREAVINPGSAARAAAAFLPVRSRWEAKAAPAAWPPARGWRHGGRAGRGRGFDRRRFNRLFGARRLCFVGRRFRRPRPRQWRPAWRRRIGMGTRDGRRWRRIQIRFHRPARRLHRLEHVGRHAVTWRRIIVGRRIRRRRTGQWAVRPRRIGRRRTRQRADRRIVGPTAKRRRRCHHADNAIGGRPRHDAIDGADRARARIDHDAHENAAIIGGADHIGRAFPARPGQRIVSGSPHDLGDLVRRHETRQRRSATRRR